MGRGRRTPVARGEAAVSETLWKVLLSELAVARLCCPTGGCQYVAESPIERPDSIEKLVGPLCSNPIRVSEGRKDDHPFTLLAKAIRGLKTRGIEMEVFVKKRDETQSGDGRAAGRQSPSANPFCVLPRHAALVPGRHAGCVGFRDGRGRVPCPVPGQPGPRLTAGSSRVES